MSKPTVLSPLSAKLERAPQRMHPAIWDAVRRKLAKQIQENARRVTPSNHVEHKPFSALSTLSTPHE